MSTRSGTSCGRSGKTWSDVSPPVGSQHKAEASIEDVVAGYRGQVPLAGTGPQECGDKTARFLPCPVGANAAKTAYVRR